MLSLDPGSRRYSAGSSISGQPDDRDRSGVELRSGNAPKLRPATMELQNRIDELAHRVGETSDRPPAGKPRDYSAAQPIGSR